MTVTGQTVEKNLAAIDPPDPDGKILHAISSPLHPTGGLTILRGSLVARGCGRQERVVRGGRAWRAPPRCSTTRRTRWRR